MGIILSKLYLGLNHYSGFGLYMSASAEKKGYSYRCVDKRA